MKILIDSQSVRQSDIYLLFYYCQGQMLIITFLLFIFQITSSYKTNPTSYICTNPTDDIPPALPSCLPGYVIDIENVFYESTTDNLCSGITLCRVENKNTLLFACNRKRTCQIEKNNLRFHINSTCGSTIRLYTEYRCLPVIQEQKDYLCEASTQRRVTLGDINLSCERNYHLHITKALIGISLKQQDESIRTRFKCNKDTQSDCNYYVPNAYRDVCERQGSSDQCKIRYNERPMLKDCQYGMTSNFSMVEYSCIPGIGITEDLPRIDICLTDASGRISSDRGLLHSPNYPQAFGQYLSCKKQLFVPRESRLRFFMLEKSIEYSHELNIYLLNNIRALTTNELLDINITNDEIIQFELKTNHVGGGKFLLYFQIDSRLSEYAQFMLEPDKKNNDDRRGKSLFKRDWAILIGCIIGLLLVLLVVAIIFIVIRISRRRRARSLRYLKSDDDHRQHLNAPTTSPDHRHNIRNPQTEQPYLASSPPTILPLPIGNGQNRPQSASSTTSSIIMHQPNDGVSDRESLIKPKNQTQPRPNATNPEIDNFYEEIKEQQQQTALALGMNGKKSVPPIRDHHENETRYQQPSNEPVIQSKKPVAPRRHPEPSAPPIHLLEKD